MAKAEAAATVEQSLRDITAGRAGLSQIYRSGDLERIRLVRAGIPAKAVRALSTSLDVPNEVVYDLLGVSRATATRLVRSGRNFGPGASERAIFIAGLVKAVEEMLPEGQAAAPSFDAAKWVAQWLEQPQPALDGERPAAFMDTADGRAIVRNLLGQLEAGVYG